MSEQITNSFIKQFEADVHVAYQQQQSKLRGMVRSKNNVKGASTTFQKVGKGTAGTKTRHGLVPTMNIDHTPVECILKDYYAGDWCDNMDELKTNIDERKITSDAGAYALGRKTDSLIITELGKTDVVAGDYSTGLTKDLALTAFETMNKNDVPDDGQRFAAVGAHQWNELLNISEFADSDYVGDQYPWLKGTESRKWLGIVWTFHNDLPLASSTNRDCFLFHKTAIGHASGQDVKSDIQWYSDRAAHFISNSMSQGAVMIDKTGIIKIKCKDNATIT